MINKRANYKDWYVSLLIIYMVCLPLNAMNIGIFGSALKALAFLPIATAAFGGRILRLSPPLLGQLVFTLFAFLSVCWSKSSVESAGRVVSYVLLFALIASGCMFRYTSEDVERIKSALAWSSRVTAALMLVFAEHIGGRYTLSGIIAEDPNYLCAYFIFGVVYAIGVLSGKAGTFRKILAAAELAVYLYIVLMTGSRGGLLAVTAAAVAYLVTNGESSLKNMLKKLVLIILVVGLVVLLIDYLPESLKIRFTVEDVIERGGSGRTELWQQSVDLYRGSNLFRQIFGYGTASIQWCFSHYGYSDTHVAHNIILETLVELGAVGTVIYVAAIFMFMRSAYKFRDKYAVAVIFGMFVMSMSVSLYTFKPYFNGLLYVLIVRNMQGAEDNDKGRSDR